MQAWDMYDWVKADGTYQSMREHQALRPSLAVTTAEGNGFGIAEIGSPQSEGRPEWLRSVARWSRNHRAVFVTYFDQRAVQLHLSTRFLDASGQGRLLFELAPDHQGTAAYRELAKEIIDATK